LAISFYTFQNIAFLVDTYRGKTPRYPFLKYVSYLAFFPHLIAGPIVRHDHLIRQFSNPIILTPRAKNIAAGLAIIMMGLFKKVVLADSASAFADPIFAAAGQGGVGFVEAWMAAVLFSFIVYFDFSGYSDIAIGLARLFNVKFPENFASPYKADSIIGFWRRWHMTLSRFLRVYVYVPLGGNRKGRSRQLAALMGTMLLGGMWHGAGWNFLIWGGLHGGYLVVNHVWRKQFPNLLPHWSGRLLTYLAVVVAWVFFRSANLEQAEHMLASMAGMHGFGFHVALPEGMLGNPLISGLGLCGALLLIVNFFPNTQEFMRLFRPVSPERNLGWQRLSRYVPVWRLSMPYVCLVAAMGMYAVSRLEHIQAFIYFRF
jgi:D-alanyl-lipoteichoic acid acyltransferase DltB (MBOAT superfamily)